jgi:hypothetical protein
MLGGGWFAGNVFPDDVSDVLRGSPFDLKCSDSVEDPLRAV